MDVWLLQNYHLPTCNNAENIDSAYCLPMTGKVIHVVGYLCGFFNNEGWTGFMPSLRNKSSADKKGCWICQPLYRYVPVQPISCHTISLQRENERIQSRFFSSESFIKTSTKHNSKSLQFNLYCKKGKVLLCICVVCYWGRGGEGYFYLKVLNFA